MHTWKNMKYHRLFTTTQEPSICANSLKKRRIMSKQKTSTDNMNSWGSSKRKGTKRYQSKSMFSLWKDVKIFSRNGESQLKSSTTFEKFANSTEICQKNTKWKKLFRNSQPHPKTMLINDLFIYHHRPIHSLKTNTSKAKVIPNPYARKDWCPAIVPNKYPIENINLPIRKYSSM